jgi:hypothetical protein
LLLQLLLVKEMLVHRQEATILAVAVVALAVLHLSQAVSIQEMAAQVLTLYLLGQLQQVVV